MPPVLEARSLRKSFGTITAVSDVSFTVDPGELDERFRRAGLRQGDFLVAVDGFAVEDRDQMVAALSFTDEPTLTAIVMRPGSGFIEVSGPYRRWKYGPVPKQPRP